MKSAAFNLKNERQIYHDNQDHHMLISTLGHLKKSFLFHGLKPWLSGKMNRKIRINFAVWRTFG